MGLDQPITTQFLIYTGNVLRGDLGTSLRYQRSIAELLAERLPVTLELGITAMLFAVFIGIPLGIISAYRRNSAVDVGTMIGANIGVSMPVFWLGLMLAYLFAVTAQRYAVCAATFRSPARRLLSNAVLCRLGTGATTRQRQRP